MTLDTLAPSPNLQMLTTPLPSPLDPQTILSSTVQALEKHLRNGLKSVNVEFEENDLSYGLEYRKDNRTIADIGTRSIEVSAVRGSNEGIYIHIRLVTEAATELCMTGKTYSRPSAAALVAGLTSLLSRFDHTKSDSTSPSLSSEIEYPQFPHGKNADDVSPPPSDTLVFHTPIPEKIPGEFLYKKTVRELTEALTTSLATHSITFNETKPTFHSTALDENATLDDMHIRWLEGSITPTNNDAYELRIRAISRTTDNIIMTAKTSCLNTALRAAAITTVLLSDY